MGPLVDARKYVETPLTLQSDLPLYPHHATACAPLSCRDPCTQTRFQTLLTLQVGDFQTQKEEEDGGQTEVPFNRHPAKCPLQPCSLETIAPHPKGLSCETSSCTVTTKPFWSYGCNLSSIPRVTPDRAVWISLSVPKHGFQP